MRITHLQELGGRQVEVGVHYLEAGAQVLRAHLCNTTMARVNKHEDVDREDRRSTLKLLTRRQNLNTSRFILVCTAADEELKKSQLDSKDSRAKQKYSNKFQQILLKG